MLVWTAKEYGYDSPGGAILHEVSHFQDVAATVDETSEGKFTTMSELQALARRKPEDAIRIAYSYQYFAENLPAVPNIGCEHRCGNSGGCSCGQQKTGGGGAGFAFFAGTLGLVLYTRSRRRATGRPATAPPEEERP